MVNDYTYTLSYSAKGSSIKEVGEIGGGYLPFSDKPGQGVLNVS